MREEKYVDAPQDRHWVSDCQKADPTALAIAMAHADLGTHGQCLKA
jgi:hypothetical protein